MFPSSYSSRNGSTQVGHLVYLRKKESKLYGKWIIGIILLNEEDMVNVKHRNYGESHPHITSRTVRQLVKLWSIEDQGQD